MAVDVDRIACVDSNYEAPGFTRNLKVSSPNTKQVFWIAHLAGRVSAKAHRTLVHGKLCYLALQRAGIMSNSYFFHRNAFDRRAFLG